MANYWTTGIQVCEVLQMAKEGFRFIVEAGRIVLDDYEESCEGFCV